MNGQICSLMNSVLCILSCIMYFHPLVNCMIWSLSNHQNICLNFLPRIFPVLHGSVDNVAPKFVYDILNLVLSSIVLMWRRFQCFSPSPKLLLDWFSSQTHPFHHLVCLNYQLHSAYTSLILSRFLLCFIVSSWGEWMAYMSFSLICDSSF